LPPYPPILLDGVPLRELRALNVPPRLCFEGVLPPLMGDDPIEPSGRERFGSEEKSIGFSASFRGREPYGLFCTSAIHLRGTCDAVHTSDGGETLDIFPSEKIRKLLHACVRACVCMYTCMYVCVYVCMCACMCVDDSA
jgi:hypothetical protein